jgi:hypothetical protein
VPVLNEVREKIIYPDLSKYVLKSSLKPCPVRSEERRPLSEEHIYRRRPVVRAAPIIEAVAEKTAAAASTAEARRDRRREILESLSEVEVQEIQNRVKQRAKEAKSRVDTRSCENVEPLTDKTSLRFSFVDPKVDPPYVQPDLEFEKYQRLLWS